MEMLEITVAMLAAFGLYSIFDLIRVSILFPKRIRKNVRVAVAFDENSFRETAAYVNYLRREQKISPERLIIIENDGIIEYNEPPNCEPALRKEKCKDSTDDTGNNGGQKGA